MVEGKPIDHGALIVLLILARTGPQHADTGTGRGKARSSFHHPRSCRPRPSPDNGRCASDPRTEGTLRRLSTRTLVGSAVLIAVILAVLKNAGELALGMVLLFGVAALGTRWPDQPSWQGEGGHCS
jgi:hypothetical protein